MRFLVVPVVLSIIILPSCGRESPTGSPQAASIRISPAEAVLDAIGATVQLTASVRDGNDREVADAAVTWTSNNTEVASETVEDLVTARKNGSAVVRAVSGQFHILTSGTAYFVCSYTTNIEGDFDNQFSFSFMIRRLDHLICHTIDFNLV